MEITRQSRLCKNNELNTKPQQTIKKSISYCKLQDSTSVRANFTSKSETRHRLWLVKNSKRWAPSFCCCNGLPLLGRYRFCRRDGSGEEKVQFCRDETEPARINPANNNIYRIQQPSTITSFKWLHVSSMGMFFTERAPPPNSWGEFFSALSFRRLPTP